MLSFQNNPLGSEQAMLERNQELAASPTERRTLREDCSGPGF